MVKWQFLDNYFTHLYQSITATMDLALEQGEVEKRIQAVQEEVKKHDDAIKELQKKLKVLHPCVRTNHKIKIIIF